MHFNIAYHLSSTEGLSVAKCALAFTTHIESISTSLSLLYIATLLVLYKKTLFIDVISICIYFTVIRLTAKFRKPHKKTDNQTNLTMERQRTKHFSKFSQ